MSKKSNGEGSIYVQKRNGKNYYTGQITVGLDSTGKQIRKSFSGYRKADVVEKMREAQFYVDKNIYSVSPDMSLSEFYKSWLETTKKPELAPRSYESYESLLRLKINTDPIARISVSKLTTIDLQGYVNRLIDNEISISGTKRALMMIKSCLNNAVDNNLLFKNPAIGVKIKDDEKTKKAENKDKYKVFTKEEQGKIINVLDLSEVIDLLIYTAFASGLRLGEIIALKWSDFDGSGISVKRQLQYISKEDQEGKKYREKTITELKTANSYRYIPLPEKVCKELQKHRLNQIEHKLRIGKEYIDTELIFADAIGQPVERKRPGRRVAKLCKLLKLKHRSFHSVRHTYCTRLFESGVPIKTVQVLMGHSESATTMDIYTHVMTAELDVAAEKISKFL